MNSNYLTNDFINIINDNLLLVSFYGCKGKIFNNVYNRWKSYIKDSFHINILVRNIEDINLYIYKQVDEYLNYKKDNIFIIFYRNNYFNNPKYKYNDITFEEFLNNKLNETNYNWYKKFNNLKYLKREYEFYINIEKFNNLQFV